MFVIKGIIYAKFISDIIRFRFPFLDKVCQRVCVLKKQNLLIVELIWYIFLLPNIILQFIIRL